MKNKLILSILTAIAGFNHCNAQFISFGFEHNSQTYKQVDAMERGGWSFAPDFYYYTAHKGYSGASWHTSWKPWPVFSISFSEAKSNVKSCYGTRLASALIETDIKKKTQAELDSITPIFQEEMLRAADRNVDLAYLTVKDDFAEMQDVISRNLKFTLERSQGKLNKSVSAYTDYNDLLCARIEYIHKTGLDEELENTKRQLAYEAIRQDMKNFMKATEELAFFAACNYDKE